MSLQLTEVKFAGLSCTVLHVLQDVQDSLGVAQLLFHQQSLQLLEVDFFQWHPILALAQQHIHGGVHLQRRKTNPLLSQQKIRVVLFRLFRNNQHDLRSLELAQQLLHLLQKLVVAILDEAVAVVQHQYQPLIDIGGCYGGLVAVAVQLGLLAELELEVHSFGAVAQVQVEDLRLEEIAFRHVSYAFGDGAGAAATHRTVQDYHRAALISKLVGQVYYKLVAAEYLLDTVTFLQHRQFRQVHDVNVAVGIALLLGVQQNFWSVLTLEQIKLETESSIASYSSWWI